MSCPSCFRPSYPSVHPIHPSIHPKTSIPSAWVSLLQKENHPSPLPHNPNLTTHQNRKQSTPLPTRIPPHPSWPRPLHSVTSFQTRCAVLSLRKRWIGIGPLLGGARARDGGIGERETDDSFFEVFFILGWKVEGGEGGRGEGEREVLSTSLSQDSTLIPRDSRNRNSRFFVHSSLSSSYLYLSS